MEYDPTSWNSQKTDMAVSMIIKLKVGDVSESIEKRSLVHPPLYCAYRMLRFTLLIILFTTRTKCLSSIISLILGGNSRLCSF